MSLLLAAALLSFAAPDPVAGRVDPRSEDGAAVMAPVEAVFAALAARDASGLQGLIDTDGRITVAIAGGEGPSRTVGFGWDRFLSGLRPGPERMEEVMVDPLVAVDGDVAVVWGRYVFRIDGAISHCGVNHFDLARTEGRWRLVNISWSQRTTGCEVIDAEARARD